MQIILRLFPESPIRLDFSYHSKLAAAIYNVIAYRDPEFAGALHDGEAHQNRIKLFGFSPLYSKQTEVYPENRDQNKSGGLIFKGPCTFTICSPWPELMHRVEFGVSKTPELTIGSQLVRVKGVARAPVPKFSEKMVWSFQQPASCVTSWSSRKDKGKRYVLPGAPVEDQSCEDLLRQNLLHKWRRFSEVRPDIAVAWLSNGDGAYQDAKDLAEKDIAVRLFPASEKRQFHQKRHYIKKAPILSWISPVEITAPLAIQRIAWSCGLGEMNSMGFGVVKEAY